MWLIGVYLLCILIIIIAFSVTPWQLWVVLGVAWIVLYVSINYINKYIKRSKRRERKRIKKMNKRKK